jgi:sulfoxide reductase heme-binding subunit YedZ
MKDPTFWILARASGLTAYALMTAAVVAGLVLKSRPFRGLKAAAMTDAHRFLTMLALGALAVHATAIVLDSTIHIGPGALVVPGLAPYRPVWTGAGVLAAELAALIAVSFPLRRRIGFRAWRRLHWATYAVFALATVHGLFAGTDSSRPAIFDLYLGSVALVAFATAWRALAGPARPSPARPVLERST